MFCFTMLGSCARSIYIFGIDWQSTLQVQQKLISRLPVESYVQLRCYCCGRILGQLSGYWATQELCKNVNFDMETKAKKLNCLSSYQGLNGSSLGQISELLRLRKESYCNVKLKCLDPRSLLVGEDRCHLVLNLFCQCWKPLKYFSQGIMRGPRRSCFYESRMPRFCSCAICLLTNVQNFWIFLYN